MRLDRFLQHNCAFTAQESLALLRSARVLVNGEPAHSVAQILSPKDELSLDGKAIAPKGFVYIMLNKPAGVVSARKDINHPTVLDLIRPENFCGNSREYENIDVDQLQIVGRLDVDTTGLLLLTNDGDWNYRATAPEYQCDKTYRVQLNSELRPGVVDAFAEGLMLQGETEKTLPAVLTVVTEKDVLLSISEGRYHQVKRMFAACKNRVRALHRESIGGLSLPSELGAGQFRFLSQAEVETIPASL